jgi:hypothetical protein
MKLILKINREKPDSTEELALNDVDRYYVNDTNMVIYFNDGGSKEIPLRGEKKHRHEWINLSIYSKREGIKNFY